MGWATLCVLILAVAGWLTGDLTGISPGVVALIAAALLSTTRILDQRDVDSIDWNVLILIWGGLSLSVAMDGSGLTRMLSSVNLSQIPGGPVVLGIGISLTALLMSTFMSNTATAGLLVPMALALSVTDQAELAMLAASACSFAMALPVSTPPNAIAFATGSVPLGSMLKTGGLIGLASIIVMLAGYKIMLPPVLERAKAGTKHRVEGPRIPVITTMRKGDGTTAEVQVAPQPSLK
jgi:sodium-dependent dicarboxylate transporter 2/3/5